jgi:signal transduction histidine kinase/CheY-like chemotaxis protein
VPHRGFRVLVTAPYGRDAINVVKLLSQAGYLVSICADPAAMAEAFTDNTGALLLTEEALRADARSLDQALADQPSWSDVPVILLAHRQEGRRPAPDLWQNALPSSATNAIVLERPLGGASLISAVGAALRSRQRQFDMRDRLAELAASREALERRDRELQFALTAGRFGTWSIDLATMTLTTSDVCRAIFGVAPDAPFTYVDLLNSIAEDDRQRMEETLDRSLQTGADYDIEYRIGGPGDVTRWVDIRGRPSYGADGRPLRLDGVALDVTARRTSEAALRDLNATLEQQVKERTDRLMIQEEALRQSQKMEAVGQLTGGIAHDFNNLLTIIRSSVDLLRRPTLAEDRRRRYLDAVSETVDRAAKLTGQLLAFARRSALLPEVFDVGARLAAVADLLDTVTGARIRVVLDLPEEVCHVRADVSQFETALVNMAVNARDAMNGEGTLTLRLRSEGGLPPIRGHGGSAVPFASVSLSDTGCGIDPDKIGRIFEPFFTTKEVGKGTGLGLSQVFGFAKQSGGDIDVASEPGQGTTFTLYLPRVVSPGDAPEPAGAEEGEAAPLGEGRRILVVEDNVEIGQFASQILFDLGYEPAWVPNAAEALARLAQDEPGFDVVFSDVVMPGMNGIDLAQEIRRLHPDLPVVLTSGYSHVLAQEGSHGFDLVHKPYSAEQLGRALQRAAAGTRATVPG